MDPIRFSFVFNKKNKLNKRGEALVQLCAYKPKSKKSTKHKFISTSIYLKPDQWDSKNKLIVKHPSAARLNYNLSKIKADFEAKVIQLINRFGACELTDLERDGKSEYLSFTDFFKQEIERCKATKTKSTITTYKTTLKLLMEISSNIHFTELNYALLQKFEGALKSQGLKQTTIAKHHKNLKFIINSAIKNDYIVPGASPYENFQVKPGHPAPRTYLLPHEIEAIERLEFSSEEMYLETERDAFLFTCYTALRNESNRILCLNMFDEFDGKFSLRMKSNKTQKYISIPIYKLFLDKAGISKPNQIICKYKNILKAVYGREFKDKPLFGDVANQTSNKRLKTIGKRAGLNKTLTTHVGRHTFGTYMVEKIPINYLQALMQHSKIATTMKYVHLDERLISEGLDKVKW